MRMKIMKPNEKTVKAVFVLFAALNAFGYDAENNPRGMSKERRLVRHALPRRSLRMRYATLARHIQKEHPWHLIHKILLRRGLVGADLRKFAKEREVMEVWNSLKTSYAKQGKMLAPVFRREVVNLIKFLKWKPHTIKRVTLVLNPLDAYWRGYSFIVKNTGYVVVGPGTMNEITHLVRHELLHSFAPRIFIPRRFTSLKVHRRKENGGYGDRAVIEREYVVRGLNLLYERGVLHKDIRSVLRREEKRFPHIRAVLTLLEK